MVFYSEASIENLIVHSIGNKLKGDSVLLSNSTVILNSDLENELLRFFLNPFLKLNEYYSFDNLETNEIYKAVKDIFNKNSSLAVESKKIANNLFHIVRSPKTLAGNLFIAELDKCIIDDNLTNAIGIFKAETVDTILNIKPSNERFEVKAEQGVNVKKLTKGCIIFNINEENGYIISVLNKKNNKDEIGYWNEDFLNIKPYVDDYYFTKSTLDCIGEFILEELPEEFNISKSSQIDLLKKTVDYCYNNDTFDLNEYGNDVLENDELIQKLDAFHEEYVNKNELEQVETFDIDKRAIQMKLKDFKSIIKLDDKFDIVVHKDTENLIRGKDEATGLDYYQLFFKIES